MPPSDEVSRHVGQRLAELRAEAGRRQEDVAAAARRLGMDWTRATVAAVETGRRQLGLDEFLVLPLVLHEALGRDTVADLKLADLIDAERAPQAAAYGFDPDLRLAPRVGVNRHVVAWWLEGEPATQGTRFLMTEQEHERLQEAMPGLDSLLDAVDQAGMDPQEAHWSSKGDAEHKAAASLGVLSGPIGPASYLRWGRSLTEERDARLAERADPSDPSRTVQAKRGHITRELIAELRPVLQQHGVLDAVAGGEAPPTVPGASSTGGDADSEQEPS